jgi:hypothetical protein
MIVVNISKKFVIAAFIFLLMPYLSSCIMMPFTMGSMLFKGNQNTENPDVISAVNKLVQKNVGALMNNRGPYEQILLGKTETDGKSIPPRKLRSMILKTLRSENVIQVFDGDERTLNAAERNFASEPTHNEVIAVLNVQLYYTEGRMLLAEQLVDLRSHKVYWSEVFAEPMVQYEPLKRWAFSTHNTNNIGEHG